MRSMDEGVADSHPQHQPIALGCLSLPRSSKDIQRSGETASSALLSRVLGAVARSARSLAAVRCVALQWRAAVSMLQPSWNAASDERTADDELSCVTYVSRRGSNALFDVRCALTVVESRTEGLQDELSSFLTSFALSNNTRHLLPALAAVAHLNACGVRRIVMGSSDSATEGRRPSCKLRFLAKIEQAHLAVIGRCSALTLHTIVIEGDSITDGDIRAFAFDACSAATRFRRLTKLQIRNVHADNTHLTATLFSFLTPVQITHVDLFDVPFADGAADNTSLACFLAAAACTLETLRLRHCPRIVGATLANATLLAMESAADATSPWSRLQTLDVSHSPLIGDHGVSALLRCCRSTLTALHLDGGLGSFGDVAISALLDRQNGLQPLRLRTFSCTRAAGSLTNVTLRQLVEGAASLSQIDVGRNPSTLGILTAEALDGFKHQTYGIITVVRVDGMTSATMSNLVLPLLSRHGMSLRELSIADCSGIDVPLLFWFMYLASRTEAGAAVHHRLRAESGVFLPVELQRFSLSHSGCDSVIVEAHSVASQLRCSRTAANHATSLVAVIVDQRQSAAIRTQASLLKQVVLRPLAIEFTDVAAYSTKI